MSENVERIEPTLLKPASPPAPAAAPERTALDQFSRMEDKLARIEEKFARFETILSRAEDRLDRATHRVEEAAKSVDAAELATEVTGLRSSVDKVPRLGGLIVTALVSAVATTILIVALLKFMPGLLK